MQKELNMQMLQTVAQGMDVAEIYSPPRIAKRAEAWGLRGGWSLDLTEKDHDGKAWDLSKKEMRRRAVQKINKDKPLLIIGSPMCTDWSSMMNLNWGKMTEEQKEKRMTSARSHLRFCVKIYKHQVKENRYYVHEHPLGARSWNEPMIRAMLKKESNILATIDQCQYGLWVLDKDGWAVAKKPTKFMTNSPCIAAQLQKRCPGKESHEKGRHASLLDGVARQAQVYPKDLCDAICKGLINQIEQDKKGQFYLASLQVMDAAEAKKSKGLILCDIGETAIEDNDEELQAA